MNVKPLLNICNKRKWLFEKKSFQQIFRTRAYNTTTIQSFPAQSAAEIQTLHDDSKKNYVNPLRFPDYFEVNNLVKVKELFDARVHLGHKLGSLNDKMRPFIFGSRFEHVIFDLEQTATHLRKALNFTAHIAYRGGIILFASNYHQHCSIIEQTAKDCKEYAHTREWKRGLLTNSTSIFGSVIRNPDLCILLNTLDSVFCSHHLVTEAAKLTIPTIAIVDSNCDPTIITYPIPGNDDSLSAIELYLNLFKQAILKGKAVREKEINEDQN